MSTVSPGPGSLPHVAAALRQHFQQLLDQAARLAEMDLEPDRFFAECLQRGLAGAAACAGAVWDRSSGDGLRLAYQVNLAQIGLNEGNRSQHEALLVRIVQSGEPMLLAPHSGAADGLSNATAHFLLLVPIVVDQQVAGVLEIWRDAAAAPDVQGPLVQFLGGMAHCASLHMRNRQRRTMNGQRQLWLRLETFSQQVHASLDLREVAYIVANQGRQLVECDRLSVVGRRRGKGTVEAISGVEKIDKRANQVRLLRELGECVLTWGETLIYRGVPEEGLPPDVLHALDAYLEASESKLLIVRPLREDGENQDPPRFALVLECFEPAAALEPLQSRLEVIGRHARAALHNAGVYRRVPLRGLWQYLADRRLPGGAVGFFATIAVAGVLAALVGMPWPLKMEASGQLLPRERRWLYPPTEGQIIRFEQGVEPGATVREGQALVLMHDTQLEMKLAQLTSEVAGMQEDIASLTAQQNTARDESDRVTAAAEKKQKEFQRNRRLAELKALRERTHADESRPGWFWLTAPMSGTVLTWDFRERLTSRYVRPSEPLLRLGDRDRGWEIELKIPYAHLAPILEAFAANSDADLDVDLLLLSTPTRTFRGKLARRQLAAEAGPDGEANEAAPVVRASVRIDGADIAEAERIPRDLLVSGSEIHARVRCGPRRLGYALFHGVWEFMYEKVLFQ